MSVETRVAAYARVSTERQAEAQTIDQQVEQLLAYARQQGWPLRPEQIYRDDGYSGARLDRPALDRLRDAVAGGEVDTVLVTSPDRLARRYAYQVWLLEEFERAGCPVVFLERPPTGDPQDALVLQIRGAVAEYERTVIADRMRRGRLAALRAGRLLPWSSPPYGYRLDPLRPRDPAGVRVDEGEAAVVRRIFAWYVEEGLSLYGIAQRLTAQGIPSATGRPFWGGSSVGKLLNNHCYEGTAYGNQQQMVPAPPAPPARPAGAEGRRAPRRTGCGPARSGSPSPSRPSSPPSASRGRRRGWSGTSAWPGATPAGRTSCRAWSAAAGAGSPTPSGTRARAPTTTAPGGTPRWSAAAAPAAAPGRCPPSAWTRWSGTTCATCWPSRRCWRTPCAAPGRAG